MNTSKTSYKKSGVDIDSANIFVERIKPLIQSTYRTEVLGDIGNFGGLFELPKKRYNRPVLVSSTDGVGTKLRIAQMLDRHDTIGIDLVAMSVNDLIVQGAEPLFFLDYLATGKINVERNVEIVSGIVKGCQEAACSLIGGENAEMPGFYENDDYDLAGFCVGIVDKEALIDGSGIEPGNVLIGLPSSGLHSNGYSLARKALFDVAKLNINDRPGILDCSIGEELLKPTIIYARPVLDVVGSFNIKGLVHVTGGGFYENIPRILPDECGANIRLGSWIIPPVFSLIKESGNIDDDEMFRVFNMGIGMIMIADEDDASKIMANLEEHDISPTIIGNISCDSRSKKTITVE